jgi:hypothetical protein
MVTSKFRPNAALPMSAHVHYLCQKYTSRLSLLFLVNYASIHDSQSCVDRQWLGTETKEYPLLEAANKQRLLMTEWEDLKCAWVICRMCRLAEVP